MMKKLEPLLKVMAVGITALLSITSALLSLPALGDFFSEQISWLHAHLSPDQATALGGVLLGLGLCLLILEIRNRGLKPRKSLAATGVLWIICSFGLIFFSPTHLKQPPEASAPPHRSPPSKAPHKGKIKQSADKPDADKGKQRPSTESALAAEGAPSNSTSTSSTPSASPSSTPSASSPQTKGGCVCSTSPPANDSPPPSAPPSSPQREEDDSGFAGIEREEDQREAAEEAQEEAEEAREEAQEAQEDAELGF